MPSQSLLRTDITGIAMQAVFLAVEQFRHLQHVGDVRRRSLHRMKQAGDHVRTNMRLHPEVPLAAFLGLVHLRIARLLPLLGQRRGRDQGGLHDRALAQHQTPLLQMGVDPVEEHLGQFVLLQQPAELQQGRGIRGVFAAQVDPDKAPDRLTVVDRILAPSLPTD